MLEKNTILHKYFNSYFKMDYTSLGLPLASQQALAMPVNYLDRLPVFINRLIFAVNVKY